MFRPTAVPQPPGVAGVPPVPGSSRLGGLIRLSPGPRREEEILRVIGGLAANLAALHEAGQAHGGICPDAVSYDASGEPILATPPLAEADAEDAPRYAGFAAFEQYTDDPAYPCGPWTDVHGLAALAYLLATGSAPPDALARQVRDDCRPLKEWHPWAYRDAFCAAVDRGLSIPAHARPQTAAELVVAMGAFIPAPYLASAPDPDPDPDLQQEPLPEVEAAGVAVDTEAGLGIAASAPLADLTAADDAPPSSTAEDSNPAPAVVLPESRPSARPILPWALTAVLLLAAGGYAWVQMKEPPVQVAAAPPPAAQDAAPAPQAAPTPTPAPVAPAQPAEPLPSARSPQVAQSAQSGTGDAAAVSGQSATAGGVASAPGTAEQGAVRPDAMANMSVEPVAPAPQAPTAPAASATPPAPAAAAERPAPPKVTPVAVRVVVRPWGEVLINGRSRGVSPPLRELSLAPGRYDVTVRNASSGEHRMTLTVAPGKPAAISHQFE